ncbi:hypothetical protein VNO77_01269 [Canavalia gladiata]|uniref:Uncharacterized protein n=1 Tax=Canavalia gladiata TaxID=3824 RepID=A0AAN9R644_CANGL
MHVSLFPLPFVWNINKGPEQNSSSLARQLYCKGTEANRNIIIFNFPNCPFINSFVVTAIGMVGMKLVTSIHSQHLNNGQYIPCLFLQCAH